MKTFYEVLEDNTIGRSTPSEKVAASLGLKLTTDREIVYGFDGKRYFKGEEPAAPEPTYAEQRAVAYPKEVEQLDMLYHDIDDGKLGEEAKTSSFYLARKEVKEAYPKPDNQEADINNEIEGGEND